MRKNNSSNCKTSSSLALYLLLTLLGSEHKNIQFDEILQIQTLHRGIEPMSACTTSLLDLLLQLVRELLVQREVVASVFVVRSC